MYKIIKDCSPYYITFSHPGMEELIDYANTIFTHNRYTHWQMAPDQPLCQIWPEYRTRYLFITENFRKKTLELTPCSNQLNLSTELIQYFHTLPKSTHPIHLDGGPKLPHLYSLNYPIKISDELCITKWFSNEGLEKTHEDSNVFVTNDSAEVLQSVTFRPDEVVLFNASIPHNWDNIQSSEERLVLAMRDSNPSVVTFEDAKRILFNL